MKKNIYDFRLKLSDNLLNIIRTGGAESPAELYKMELDYLKKVLFESRELENLIRENENE